MGGGLLGGEPVGNPWAIPSSDELFVSGRYLIPGSLVLFLSWQEHLQ